MSVEEAKSFKCSGCGAPLKIPSNSKGRVTCPSCRTDCVIEGLIKNAEIADKAHINSGISLSSTPSILHRQVVNLLAENRYIPLDVFEKADVVREEHYCVPAFYFEFTAEAPYRYQQGRRETRQEQGYENGNHVIKTIEETKWYPQNGHAQASGARFVSGNKELAPYINHLYLETNASDLVDVEYLEYPHDVQTLDFNVPEGTVLNETIKPIADKLIENEVAEQLKNETYTKDVNISASKITRDVKRVFFGLYRVVYKYNGKEYSVWANGDGKKVCREGIPEDQNRKAAIEEKIQAKAAVPCKTGWHTFGLVVGILAAIVGGIVLLSEEILIGLAIFLPGLAIAILCGIKKAGIQKVHDAKCAEIQSEIDAIDAQATSAVQKFKSQKQALVGIYGDVSGDSSAF